MYLGGIVTSMVFRNYQPWSSIRRDLFPSFTPIILEENFCEHNRVMSNVFFFDANSSFT